VSGYRVGLIGATGAVGRQILEVLGDRRFPVGRLRAFGSEGSIGEPVELLGEEYIVEQLTVDALSACELVFGAAPVVENFLPKLEGLEVRIVDVSGAFELDPDIPLYLAGWRPQLPLPGQRSWVGIPRGVAAGLGLVLGPLSRESAIRRLSICALESAGGAGRRGAEALSEQTIELLNAMSGDLEQGDVFPRPLAFDCLPQIGLLLESGETSEEARLRHVLRRLLDSPQTPIEVTRIRVPIFSGSLACVHAELAAPVSPERARDVWAASEGVRVMEDPELPSPRRALVETDAVVGRIRMGDEPRSLSFVVALDDLRRGAALGAVLAAEALVAS